MNKVSKINGLIAIALSSLATQGNAASVLVSTGDLGNNVILDAGLFETALNANTPSNALPAAIAVKYGLWNSPPVDVSVFFNDSLVGSFLASTGYISPGPAFANFDVTALLLDGPNTISFNGFGANDGDYVVGQVDLRYDDGGTSVVPLPAAFPLFLFGLASLGFLARRREKTAV